MGLKQALVEGVMIEITLVIIKEVAKLSLGGADKKKKATEMVIKKLNEYENIAPVLASYLNNPGIDKIERETIEYLVQTVYDNVYKS